MEKVNKIITWLVRVGIVLIAIWTVMHQDYGNTGILVITMLVTFYDILLKKVLKIQLDIKLKIAIILFIFGAQCMGSVLDFYGKFLWWDTMLHGISGIIFFFVGTTIFKEVAKRKKQENIHSILVVLFGMCFSLAIGVTWEIFEFCVDRYLGGNMQVTQGLSGQAAVEDTMIDLISVTIGTALIGIYEGRKSKD